MTDFVHFPRPGKNDPYVPSASLLRMRTTPHQPPVSLRCRNLPLSLAWADHRKPHLHLPATPCEDKYHRNVCFPQAQRSFGSFPKIHPKWSREASLRPYQCNCNAQIKIPPNCLLQSYPKSCSLEPCVVSDLTLLGYCIHIKVCPCCELTVALCCQTICVALCSSRFPL